MGTPRTIQWVVLTAKGRLHSRTWWLLMPSHPHQAVSLSPTQTVEAALLFLRDWKDIPCDFPLHSYREMGSFGTSFFSCLHFHGSRIILNSWDDWIRPFFSTHHWGKGFIYFSWGQHLATSRYPPPSIFFVEVLKWQQVLICRLVFPTTFFFFFSHTLGGLRWLYTLFEICDMIGKCNHNVSILSFSIHLSLWRKNYYGSHWHNSKDLIVSHDIS